MNAPVATRPAPVPERPPRSRGPWAVAFVAASLVALGLVPVLLGRRAADVEREIAQVLEPARLLGTRLSLLHARQMSYFQAFLLTGDRSFRSPYVSAQAQEDTIYARLNELVRTMDLEVRERVARLSTASARWHVGHQAAFDSEEARARMMDALTEEQGRYADIQRATIELERIIQSEVDAGRRRMERTRQLQNRITLGLVILALGATFVVALVGAKLRSLTAESERRRGEAVRARREIDALLEATGDGVLGIDLEGRCISLNRAGSRLLGYNEREIRGRDVHDTVHHTRSDGAPRPREESPILRCLAEGGRAQSDDDVLWRRDRTSFPARWWLQPLVDGIEVRGAVLTFTDMTPIREKEEALRRAVRARDEVVSIVSHDLKNPLGVIGGAAELLLELPLGEEDRRRQTEIIQRGAERMSRLVEDLLDVARIEAGALVLRTAAEEVTPILAEVRDHFDSQARAKGLELGVEIEPGTPAARVDRDRIMQAISNLTINALKFTPRGGRVTLSAAPGPGERTVLIAVADTGPGVPADQLGHLFDRFWQANRGDRTGSGLGLSIVRGIAEAHGGSVDVRSSPGEGATFSLVVPAA